jgi:hypothetical protein
LSEPKFKIGETVVVTEVDSISQSDYIGRVGIVGGYYKRGFVENNRDYQVKIYNGEHVAWFYANVREATEMDKVLEGL